MNELKWDKRGFYYVDDMNPLHNPHYTPLCKMDEVYGEGTVERLRAAKGPWEFFKLWDSEWERLSTSSFFETNIYRLAPAIPMTVPWDAIAEGWDWAAADSAGDCFIFRKAPEIREDRGEWWDYDDGLMHRLDGLFSGFDRGTVDWRDSLQRRPGK